MMIHVLFNPPTRGRRSPRRSVRCASAAWLAVLFAFGVHCAAVSAGGDAAAGSAPMLVAGDGFAASREIAVDRDHARRRGGSARAIARWDVVPHQTVTGPFSVGVLAFHINGIDRVEFSLEGGPWQAVEQPTMNPRTGAQEYWVKVDAGSRPDGPMEVRAVAYPTVGVPRPLEPLVLAGNAAGSLAEPVVHVDAVHGSDESGDGSPQRPFRTLWRASTELHHMADGADDAGDGAFIACAPGQYHWFRPKGVQTAATRARWLTVTAADGVGRREVVITAYTDGKPHQGLDTKLVRFENLTLSGPQHSLNCAVGRERRLWLDGCRLEADGLFWTGGWYDGVYATDCVAEGVTTHAFVACDLLRNCHVRDFAGDAFKGGVCVVNCTAAGQDPSGRAHSDVWQPMERRCNNIILYGLTATRDMRQQGLFTRNRRHRDVAIVNCLFRMSGYPGQHQWRTRTIHLLLLNNTFLGTRFQLALSDKAPQIAGFLGSRDVLIERNVFQWFEITDTERRTGSRSPGYHAIDEGTVMRRNHFINRWPAYTAKAGESVGEVYGLYPTSGWTVPDGVGAEALRRGSLERGREDGHERGQQRPGAERRAEERARDGGE